MENKNSNTRTLAYQKSKIICKDALVDISGGSDTGSTVYTSKQTADTSGFGDFGVDVRFDF